MEQDRAEVIGGVGIDIISARSDAISAFAPAEKNGSVQEAPKVSAWRQRTRNSHLRIDAALDDVARA
jgi:hypothetical protein